MSLITTSTPTVPICKSLTRPVRDTDVSNLVADFHPPITTRWNGAETTQKIIGPRRYNESRKEIDVIYIGGTYRHRFADGADEADDVDENTANVGCVSAPVETKGKIIRGGWAGVVEVADLIEAATDDVVVADDNAGDGGEEDGVGGKVGCEVVGG